MNFLFAGRLIKQRKNGRSCLLKEFRTFYFFFCGVQVKKGIAPRVAFFRENLFSVFLINGLMGKLLSEKQSRREAEKEC
jgi:hypothetical protein